MTEGSTASAPSLLKNLVRGTALYSVALFGQRIASLLLLPINTHFLSPADYGVLDLLEQIGTIASVLLGLNISAALGYFYFEEKTPEARNTVVSTILVGAVLIGAFAGLMGALLSGPIGMLVFGRSDYRLYLMFVFVSLPLGAILEAQFSWLRVTNRPSVYAAASLGRVAIGAVMTVLLVALYRLRIIGVLTSSVTAVVGSAAFLAVYSRNKIRLTFDRALFFRVFRFSFPIGLSSIAMFIINFGDRFVLRYYQTLTDVGIYAVAYKIGMIMSFVQSSFLNYWSAQVYDVARRSDADYVIARIFTYMVLALSFAAVALVVICRPAVAILATRPGFERAAVIAPLIVLAYYVRSIGDFFKCFIYVAGRSDYDAVITWTGAVFCMAGYAALIPHYGMWGAAVATLLTFTLIASISGVWAYRLHPFQVEGIRLVKIVAVCVVILVPYFAFPVRAVLLQVIWSLALMIAFPVLLWVCRFLLPGEVEKLKGLRDTAIGRARDMLTGGRNSIG